MNVDSMSVADARESLGLARVPAQTNSSSRWRRTVYAVYAAVYADLLYT